jgi:porphyrinogen peroxidase
MSTAQSAILPEAAQHALYMVINVTNKSGNIVKQCSLLPTLIESIKKQNKVDSLFASLAFGADYWDAIHPGSRPQRLKKFIELGAGDISAPATGGDIFLHVHSDRKDMTYVLASEFLKPIKESIDVLDEVDGFHYLDDRDLTDFIDGTENPEGEERSKVALIDDEPEFNGGSYVLAQRFVHNLPKWQTVADDEQEKVIGRTKPDSIELDEDVMPETSHVSRVVIEEDGEELEIVRHSLPYGQASGDAGLFFLAYSKDNTILEKMLANIFGISGDGLHDHLMNYTAAKSGAYFFAPSVEMLKGLGN